MKPEVDKRSGKIFPDNGVGDYRGLDLSQEKPLAKANPNKI